MMDAGTEDAHMTGPGIRFVVKLCCVVIALAKTFWFSAVSLPEKRCDRTEDRNVTQDGAGDHSPAFLPVAALASTKA